MTDIFKSNEIWRKQMTFFIENETDINFDFPLEETVELVVNEVLDFFHCPYEVEINVLLTDDLGMQGFNLEMRGIDRSTDVLSFPNIEFQVSADFSVVEGCVVEYFQPDTGELILGDIIISVDKVKEQAESYGHSEKREFAFLIAHSMLHLCGLDHMEEKERIEMELLQEKILQNIGITRD